MFVPQRTGRFPRVYPFGPVILSGLVVRRQSQLSRLRYSSLVSNGSLAANLHGAALFFLARWCALNDAGGVLNGDLEKLDNWKATYRRICRGRTGNCLREYLRVYTNGNDPKSGYRFDKR